MYKCPKCGQYTLIPGKNYPPLSCDDEGYKEPDHCVDEACKYDESEPVAGEITNETKG